MKKEFVHSFNEETFNSARFESVEECLEDARENACDEQTVFIGTVAEPKISLDRFGDDILDNISEQLGDEVGEVSDNFDPSQKERAVLNDKIEKAVQEWLLETGGYHCFKVTDIGHYNLATGEEIL